MTATWSGISKSSVCAASMPATSAPVRMRLKCDDYGAADAIITNPPWSRDLMHRLIAHFQNIGPTWLLLGCGLGTDQAGSTVPAPCSDIVAIGRAEMDRGLQAHRQGQLRLVQVRYQAQGWPRLPRARSGHRRFDSNFEAAHLRAMPQGLRTVAAIQFTVLFASMQATGLSQEA